MNLARRICFASCVIALFSSLAYASTPSVDATAERTKTKPALPQDSPVLPLEVDMTAAQTFIRLGFGLDRSVNFQSTEMLTPIMRTVQAQQLIQMVVSYNNFEGKKVAEALTEFRGHVSSVQFGREGSPVIYIQLPYWTHQQEETRIKGQEGKCIPGSVTDKLVERLRHVMVEKLAADEFTVEYNRVRVWWD
jgi:hypothetical protein